MILPMATVASKSSSRATANPRSVSCLRGVVERGRAGDVGHGDRRRTVAHAAAATASRAAARVPPAGSVPITASTGTDSSYWRFTFTTNPARSSVALRVVGRLTGHVGDRHRRRTPRHDQLDFTVVAGERARRGNLPDHDPGGVVGGAFVIRTVSPAAVTFVGRRTAT